MSATSLRASRFALTMLAAAGFVFGNKPSGSAQEPLNEKQFVYKENLNRTVGLLRGGLVLRGTLDAKGNFIPSPTEKPVELRRVDPAKLGYPIINLPQTETGYKSKSGTYVAVTPPETVFEYRSGRIFSGKLDEVGNFIPQGTVGDFDSYRYRKGTPRIYNLPGEFVEKKSEKK